jgi:hypothetical protein
VRVVFALFLAFGFTLGTAETVNFERSITGLMPPGWTVSCTDMRRPARWQVEIDRSDPHKPHVLAQLSSRSGPHDYTIALFDKSTIRDGDVSVNLKLVSGRAEQSAGVVWRYQDSGNFYFAVASADKDRVGIYKKSKSEVSLVAHAMVPHRIDDREWNVLRVAFKGPRMSLYFGHRKLIEVQDSTFDKGGKTGVWTKADTVAYFDNFRLDKKN